MSINLAEYPQISTYDFKTRLSYYLRMLKNGRAQGIVVKSYDKPVALLTPLKFPDRDPSKMRPDNCSPSNTAL